MKRYPSNLELLQELYKLIIKQQIWLDRCNEITFNEGHPPPN